MEAHFEKSAGQNREGAIKDENANSLEECYAACLNASLSECAQFDYCEGADSSEWMGCWVHEESTTNEPLSSSDHCDHYQRLDGVQGNTGMSHP